MLAVFLPFGVVYWIQEWVKVLSWAERQEVWRYLSLLVLPGVGQTLGLNSTLPNRNDGSTIHKVGVCWRQTEKLVLWGFSRPMNSCSLRDKDFAKMVSHLRTLHLYQMTNAHKSMAEKLSGPTAVLQSHSDCWSVLRGLRNFAFLFAGAWK